MDYNSLVEGQEVEYEVRQGSDGRSKAVGVKPAGYQAQPDEPEEVAAEGESTGEAATDNL